MASARRRAAFRSRLGRRALARTRHHLFLAASLALALWSPRLAGVWDVLIAAILAVVVAMALRACRAEYVFEGGTLLVRLGRRERRLLLADIAGARRRSHSASWPGFHGPDDFALGSDVIELLHSEGSVFVSPRDENAFLRLVRDRKP